MFITIKIEYLHVRMVQYLFFRNGQLYRIVVYVNHLVRFTSNVLSPPVAQSFNFLVEVGEFKNSVYAVVDHQGGTNEPDAGEDFGRYLAIVKEYIESNAPSEVQGKV